MDDPESNRAYLLEVEQEIERRRAALTRCRERLGAARAGLDTARRERRGASGAALKMASIQANVQRLKAAVRGLEREARTLEQELARAEQRLEQVKQEL